jgi:peroxiredoxin
LFYPFDFSSVCTTELCEFKDAEWLTFTPELDVIGISTDSAYSHRRFINEYELPFPLLSDHDGSVSEKYDTLANDIENHPVVSQRAVYVIEDTETIRYSWKAEDAWEAPDLTHVYSAVDELESLNTAA